MIVQGNTLIESLGIYLPPETVSTEQVLQDCVNPIRFPLEKITGIRTRRMAGKQEFAIDLSRKAIEDCLAKSRYGPADIDILISCNISRVDAAEMVSYEPSTAVKLRKHFGFDNALAFDITNACAGMFTGIYIVNALLRTGAVKRGLVVSGEYITHLTQNAQIEIENFMDDRLACLTLGDAGAAVLLESSNTPGQGFEEMDLQTFGRYSPYCIARESAEGRWMMYTDSVNLTDAGIKNGAKFALDILNKAGWQADQFEHLILHQTSKMTLNSAKREINDLLNRTVFHDGNTINNLEERGNTASTSHFIALADMMRSDRIRSGDKVVFSITASGLTLGTGLYVFDNLPERFSQPASQRGEAPLHAPAVAQTHPRPPGIRMESAGILPEVEGSYSGSLEILHQAAAHCLGQSTWSADDIGLLIYTGVYRDEYLMEPAYAALLAGKLEMNATPAATQKTLAFDIFNGALGFLNGCYVAQQMIAAGTCSRAMITASECENNRKLFPDELIGIRETASAVILDAHPSPDRGFSRFVFRYLTEAQEAYSVNCSSKDARPRLMMDKSTGVEDDFLACILLAVQELLQLEGLEIGQIDRVFPPQISSAFIGKLSREMNLPQEMFVDVVGDGPDLFSSSIPFAVNHAQEQGLVKPGDKALIIAVGSGIQTGCAIYFF